MLRKLQEDDFNDILTIEELTQISPWTLETFERCWQAGYLGWVAEENDHVVGFLIATLHTGESHILNLGVHPDFQRRGLGTQLLLHALDFVKIHGGNTAFLEVRRTNSPAIALYVKEGFVQIGERKGYYQGKEDALVFAKDLSV